MLEEGLLDFEVLVFVEEEGVEDFLGESEAGVGEGDFLVGFEEKVLFDLFGSPGEDFLERVEEVAFEVIVFLGFLFDEGVHFLGVFKEVDLFLGVLLL